jgi:uncharacterized coiled-coil protein SlyX
MSIRTNVSDALDQVETNQLAQLRHNVEQEERIVKLEQLIDLFEQAISALTTVSTENAKDITNLYTNLDTAMQDIDAISANP